MQVTEISSKRYKLPSESERALSKQKMEKMRKEGEKMVHGIFEFVDAQGGWLDFSYRYFPGEPIRTIHIVHGESVDVPTILMKHLNNCYKKVRVMPDNLDASKGSVTKISRTRFIPLDSM